MDEWPRWRAYQAELAERKQHDSDNGSTESAQEDTMGEEHGDPIELMESAERAYNAQVEADLRQRLQQADPGFFERAVLDVLWTIGYGGDQGERKHVGRSGDDGIDGVISQDRLGLTNIYIQAKRYADDHLVGSPEIRNFIGALDSHNSTRGIFMTTSRYTDNARRTAKNYHHGTIVLIDGIELTELMVEYGIGVQARQRFTVYDVDEDYFEQ